MTERELPKLTPAELAFAEALLSGKTATDAYRESHPNARMNNNSLKVQACRWRAKPKIQEWLRIARLNAMDTHQVTLESHLAELARLRETALEFGQAAAGVQAEVHRGKASGLYEDHMRLTITHMSDVELLNSLRNLLGEELTAKLEADLGISHAQRIEGSLADAPV